MTDRIDHITILGAPPVEIHDLLASTNEEARRLIATGNGRDGWIVARQQSSGRGRRGRPWISEKGNLFATRMIEPRMPLARAPELSFVTSLAVFDAVSAQLDIAAGPVTCKWPNDILIKRRKVAGLLLESEGPSGWVVAGIGINIKSFPDEMEFPATSLKAEGSTAEFGDVLPSLVNAFEHWYGLWRQEGFETIREIWRQRAAGMGGSIRVRLEGRDLSGTFVDIDKSGALLLRLANGTMERIAAGDVFFA